MGPGRPVAAALLLASALAVSACGSDEGASGAGADAPGTEAAHAPARGGAEIAHVHGLGVDPASGALYVATHDGLFRAAGGSQRLQPVGDERPDVMGFSVVGPRRFIGSGHPDPGAQGPPDLGLIESRDGGVRWRTVSLAGEADFHVLRASGRRVYGFDGATGDLMVSGDGGRAWTRRTPPAPMFDLAISPADARSVVASTEQGLFASTDAGRSWDLLRADMAGLLAWASRDRLFLIDGGGRALRSSDGGRHFGPVGSIGGQPSAFAGDAAALYAALADGTVVRSADGGATWAVRARP